MPIAPDTGAPFVVADMEQLEHEHMRMLASGRLGAIFLRNVFSHELCDDAVEVVDAAAWQFYDGRRVMPPITRFGPAINDHRGPTGIAPTYWQSADDAFEKWDIAGLHPNPFEVLKALLGAGWGKAPAMATIGGKRVYAGVVREINDGAKVHFDSVVHELGPRAFDQTPIAQLALNVYLLTPSRGGRTTVWRRTWREGDERYRVGYGYAPDVVADCASASVEPSKGCGLLFNSAYYHAVEPALHGRRVAIATFVGVTAEGDLVLWS